MSYYAVQEKPFNLVCQYKLTLETTYIAACYIHNILYTACCTKNQHNQIELSHQVSSRFRLTYLIHLIHWKDKDMYAEKEN